MVGKPLSDLDLAALPDILLLAAREAGVWKYNPPRSYELQPGVVLIFLGTPDDLDKVRVTLGGEA